MRNYFKQDPDTGEIRPWTDNEVIDFISDILKKNGKPWTSEIFLELVQSYKDRIAGIGVDWIEQPNIKPPTTDPQCRLCQNLYHK